MASAALPLSIIDNTSETYKEVKESIFETHTDEIIIGLCGPIGTDIHFVADILDRILSDKYNYKCKVIRLSDLIRTYAKDKFVFDEHDTKFNNYQKLINGGNSLRQEYSNSILAELAINEIAVQREVLKGGEEYESQRVCYIIDSLKNKEELELFRLIYRDIFYFIGVYSSIDVRVSNLENKDIKTYEVHQLIDRDSGEEMNFGQNVTDTFTESDFFLRVENTSKNAVEPKIERFLNLIFSSDITTPSTDETAMYLAFAAAGNSACLSRQVGAAITDAEGEIFL